MFSFIYTFLSALLYLVAIPFIFLLSFKEKYRLSIPARFFLKRNPPLKEGGVWFHVCSFGEAKAAAPLVERFSPKLRRMSATTQTGFNQIKILAPTQSRYLPFEPLLWLWIKPQKALVVMEAELWYLLFSISKRRGAYTFLVNARISDRSWPKYKRFSFFYRILFTKVDRVFAQSQKDLERLEALGARNVEVVGNLKLSDRAKPTRRLSKPEGYLVCAASTHEGEEGVILEAFKELKSLRPEAKMTLVPRHPERFEKVWRMMEAFAKFQGWSVERFSKDESFKADLTLVDCMGELVNCYSVSDLVILGGAFEPIGGHNAAEAAQFGIPIISGPHYFNQEELFAGIEGITIVDKADLKDILRYPKLLEPTRLKFGNDVIGRIEKEIKSVL